MTTKQATATERRHLVVLGSTLAKEGPLGCDYAWNDDHTSYRCLPHRWLPGSDASYAAWQTGQYATDE